MADGPLKITVLEGDETGQELLEQSLRVLDPEVVGLAIELDRYDLSLERRRETGNEVVHEAARAMRDSGFGIKAATVTPEGRDDVGSPNRILREEIGGKVIIRTGRRIPGVTPVAGVHHPISVVRMAIEDAYGAKQWREGDEGAPDEVAFRTERITRSVCRAVSEYAFRQAAQMGGRVYGGPKWTVSPVYEGMLKEEMDAAAARHPDVDLSAGPDRRHVRGPDLRRRGCAARHPGAQPRRRLPERPRDADVRLDRRRRERAAGLRRRLRHEGRDGRGPARHRAGAGGQGRRQPDGDAAQLRRGPALRGRSRVHRGAAGARARSTRASWRRPPPASGRRTSAATTARPSSPTDVVERVSRKIDVWSSLGSTV